MIEHYKRLVSLVLEMHDEQIAEDGAHNPSGVELEAILLASHIRELEDNQNALNQKESVSDEVLQARAMEMAVSTSIALVRLYMDVEREGREGKSSVATAAKINNVIKSAIYSFCKANS